MRLTLLLICLLLSGCAMLNPAAGLKELYQERHAELDRMYTEEKIDDTEYAKLRQELFLAERQERMNLIQAWAATQQSMRPVKAKIDTVHCRPDLLGEGYTCK